METFKEFERYIAQLCQGLGHADRHVGLKGCCTGLMLPLARKSVEFMAAGLDPQHVSVRHRWCPRLGWGAAKSPPGCAARRATSP